MVQLNSTSGAKVAQAEWFASDIVVPLTSRSIMTSFQITSAVAIAYTLNSGTNWTVVSSTPVADKAWSFVVTITSGDQFNIRKATAGDVTVTECTVDLIPNSLVAQRRDDRFSFSENRTTNSSLYYTPAGNNVLLGSATESKRRIPITSDFVITRFRANVDTNGKDANTVVSIRDDAADATTLTYSAAETGEKDSGAILVFIQAGSEIAFKSDTSASSNGNAFSLALATIEGEYV